MSTGWSHDAIVVGAGPTGLVAALALARVGLDVALVAPGATPVDARTTALLGGSMDLMDNLGVGRDVTVAGTALSGIRIVDDRGGLLRAPDVVFRAAEIDREAFGVNIANSALVHALDVAVAATGSIARFAHAADSIAPDDADVTVRAGPHVLRAPLVVGADGRNAPSRAAAGIVARTWRYPQAALVANVVHTRSHDGISTEFHRTGGPLTTVPLRSKGRGFASSLVWVDAPQAIAGVMASDDSEFLGKLDERLHGLLGALSDPSPRASFPLSGLAVDVAGQRRIALVGEAAHVVPPIGAQGLNLGLRDAASLADCVADARARGEDIGGQAVLARYAARRSPDVSARVNGVDLLNRSLLLDFFPVQAARGIGLHLLANSAALRRAAMHSGLEPVGVRPRLMQPGALRGA